MKTKYSSFMVLGLVALSCAGPQPLEVAIWPQHRTAYFQALSATEGMPRQAHFDMMAAATGRDPQTLARLDLALSETANPFDAYRDSDAVSRGAVIYEMHCMECHGGRADGHGPRALPDHRPADMHTFGKRLASTLHRGAPKSWFRKIRDGYGETLDYPSGAMQAMPAQGGVLAREQIWLVITYLQSLDRHARPHHEAAAEP